MNLCPNQMSLLFLLFLLTSRIDRSSSNHFNGDISINCGSNGASTASTRPWLGDSKLSSLLQINGKSTTSTVNKELDLDDPVPYKTARISRSKFSYAFQVDPGQKIIRLHFNPSPYKGFTGFKDFFTVQSGGFTLLRNFSASFAAEALGVKTFSKEFCLSIQQNQQLTITFSPESIQSLDTYAFINGIEILAVPAALSYFGGHGDIGLQVVGEKSMVSVDNNTALEIIHRRNIKQDPVLSNGDSGSIFPKWATQELKKKKSSTWKVPVMVGFRYLVRLHFSEMGLKIARTGEMKFEVLINDMIAQNNSDILTARDGNYFPLYRDYIVIMAGLKTDGKRDILISSRSHDELRDGHGVLLGFEIVKLSNPDNSLDSPTPLPSPQETPSKTGYLISILGHVNGTSTIAITIISLINIIVYKLRHIHNSGSTREEIRPSDRAERLFTEFSLSEVKIATDNFNMRFLVGRGGFGNVYKGILRGTDVAIKRLKPGSSQGAREFLTEIETLSELRHINLVSLIGFCQERGEMILVYEYMPNGTLADHLYRTARRNGNFSSPLTWKQRLNICIEAGRGLDYLHTGLRIIHRDVKASNILLDESFIAKVSDFGLAKPEDRNRLQSHVSTRVKGTFGYFDPYYMNTQRLTKKSDTYALGVVLFEVLCGRPAIDRSVLEEERVLITWVRDKISRGEVKDIVDSSLRQEISPGSLMTFVEAAEKCLHDQPNGRPTMSQLVLQLEFALEKQGDGILALPNEIVPVANDVSPSNEEIVTSSESTEPSSRAASPDMLSIELSPAKKKDLYYSPSDSSKELRKPKKCNLLWCLACCACRRRTKQARHEFKFTETKAEVAVAAYQPSDSCRYFSLHEIKKATSDFDDSFLISKEGYGNLYKGLLDDGTTVAIKRLNPLSNQLASEFNTEIRTLSELRHRHLVSLRGYCNESVERILVYDYMVHGTLRNHLNESENSPLTWKQRLEICLGVAKGLDYLHTGVTRVVIHGDVTSTNILLNENWAPKMWNFDLSKIISDSDWNTTHVSTVVKGTLGYLDPEYYLTQRLSTKSDVYSFGVVMFEVLSARPAIISRLPTKQANLAEWGKYCFDKGKLDKIIDSNLKGQITPKCLNEFVETAVVCVSITGDKRPTMRDVIRNLEYAMQLQEDADADEAPSLPRMMTTTSHVHNKESHYEHGLESTRNQKAKLLPQSSVIQSDDDSFS